MFFSEHAPEVKNPLSFAKKLGIPVDSTLHYDDKEILSYEWAIVNVGEFQYPQPEDHYIEATYDTNNFCPRCGMGEIQNNPFRLKKDFSQKQAKLLGLHWVFDEIFVPPEIINIFEVAGISSLTYREVIRHKSNEPIPNLFQMNIPILDHPAVIKTDFSPVTCKKNNEESYVKGIGRIKDRHPGLPYCGRVNFHYSMTKPFMIRKNTLSNMPDFIKSYEAFGSGGLAFHLIFARTKVLHLLKEKGIRGLGYTRPIHLVE